MSDLIFEDPRLAQIYDPLDPKRVDLDAYIALVEEFGVHSVLDVGCGTGTFACRLARRGKSVTGIDPAHASLGVAYRKSGAEKVHWISGDVTKLPPLQVDLVTMTGNVAQVFLTDVDWLATLHAIYAALRPNGLLVFETRDPAREAWKEWNRAHTLRRLDLPEIGAVETWVELTEATPPLISFRTNFVFGGDDRVSSHSTLRFRSQTEIDDSLGMAGFIREEVRGAPDRPGLEFVVIARRSDTGTTAENS